MATTAPERPLRPRGARHTPERPMSGGGWELFTWYFMRLSGLVLLFLVLGHFTIVHLIDTGVDRVNFAFVSGRWSSPFWQTYDAVMLVLGMLHGTNGMRVIVEDYVRPGRRVAVKSLLYFVAFVMIVLGLLIIVTFDPTRGSSAVLVKH